MCVCVCVCVCVCAFITAFVVLIISGKSIYNEPEIELNESNNELYSNLFIEFSVHPDPFALDSVISLSSFLTSLS